MTAAQTSPPSMGLEIGSRAQGEERLMGRGGGRVPASIGQTVGWAHMGMNWLCGAVHPGVACSCSFGGRGPSRRAAPAIHPLLIALHGSAGIKALKHIRLR
ncbi:hypothetical protein NDU88_005452 [Pleurodeles waltl]|uniref:Uncharacterized protein n=1 Tax=Pleurodeles waltl TaxID=8319 RepID=A0AAV7MYF2_PLEWA|nr:hypothetical protein NDU88_005452 [Pleurodeles waltl]